MLPNNDRDRNLVDIANIIKEYDVVALQEVDAGSIRSRHVSQVRYFAEECGFPHWHQQQNRRIGNFAAHANGLLTRVPAETIIHHKLPGLIPGRGAMQAIFDLRGEHVLLLAVHLALSPRARKMQLQYLKQILVRYPYFILMGDMNCEHNKMADELGQLDIQVHPEMTLSPTYPSWKPRVQFDQIWVSPNLKIKQTEVLQVPYSDHLPIAVEIEVPLAEAIAKRFIN